jgi:hypothetical protein
MSLSSKLNNLDWLHITRRGSQAHDGLANASIANADSLVKRIE